MKVVVTGGAGFIGVALARRLLSLGSLAGRPIDSLILFDAAWAPDLDDARVQVVVGDVADRELVGSLIDRDDIALFHLASIVSHGGELDFDLALRVNLDGSRNVLEACRALPSRPLLVATSTYATFGGEAMPETVSDTTRPTPQTTYGATKAMLELLVNDYTRKGFLDGRVARLPTVVVRPGAPNPAASAWVSSIFREPLAGQPCVVPVPLGTRVPVTGVRTVVEGLIRLAEVDGTALRDDRSLNFPNVDVTGTEMLESLRRVGAGRTLGPVEVRIDPAIEAIVGTWATRATFERATELGLPRDADLDTIVRAYIEDFGPGTPGGERQA